MVLLFFSPSSASPSGCHRFSEPPPPSSSWQRVKPRSMISRPLDHLQGLKTEVVGCSPSVCTTRSKAHHTASQVVLPVAAYLAGPLVLNPRIKDRSGSKSSQLPNPTRKSRCASGPPARPRTVFSTPIPLAALDWPLFSRPPLRLSLRIGRTPCARARLGSLSGLFCVYAGCASLLYPTLILIKRRHCHPGLPFVLHHRAALGWPLVFIRPWAERAEDLESLELLERPGESVMGDGWPIKIVRLSNLQRPSDC